MDTFTTILFIWIGLIVAIVIGVVIYLVVIRGKYKHYYFRLILTSAKPIGKLDRAREFKEKDGTIFWKLLSDKATINIPPIESMIPLSNGALFVKAYDLGNKNFRYAREDLEKEAINKLNALEKELNIDLDKSYFSLVRSKLIEGREKGFINLILKNPLAKPAPLHIYPQEVFTQDFIKEMSKDVIGADERQNAYNQIKKAYEKKIKGWETLILPVVVIVALVVIISVMFIFGGEVVKPMIEVNAQSANILKSAQGISTQQAQLMNYLAVLLNEKQIALPAGMSGVNVVNNTAPG